MGQHLEPVRRPAASEPDPFDEDAGDRRGRRPAWWRWVAVVVAVAMVVATPFAYALYLVLR